MIMPLLWEYFQELPRRHAGESSEAWGRRFPAGLRTFHKQVAARYAEGTLERLLRCEAPGVRQATVLALGMCGTMRISRPLSAMLHDEDEGVRRLAHDALWSVWFRAESPKNNRELQRLIRKSAGGATAADVLGGFERLLTAAPGFAEAYNQRAMVHFRRGDFDRAVADCRKALQLNPQHFGAAGGLAQCYSKQKKYYAALRAYRRALRLNPDLDGVPEAIEALEKKVEEEGQK